MIKGALAATFVVLFVAGLGIGVVSSMSLPASTTQATSTMTTTGTTINQSASYQLTLVEIMDVAWNSTMMQPKFSVLGEHGLESSANISIPAHRLIQLTIVSYDTPTANSSAQYAKVEGTVGGTMSFINGTLATGIANETMAQMMSLGKNVTSVPSNSIAHTFTVPQLSINVPVVGGSTEIVYLDFNQTGTYSWFCMTPCGFGPDGNEGAMSTAGWMTGSIVVS